ncbi:MAG: type II toxin-antitoxin system RelE/ParE family toxin [Magnetococcus sp. DMHC-8]
MAGVKIFLTGINGFGKFFDMEWDLKFFNDSVRHEIEGWPAGIRASFIRIAHRMRWHGPNLGMPFTRSFGDGLFEIRAKGREGIGRAFFCLMVGRNIFILHAFIKKTDKPPHGDLETALRRMKEVGHEQ